MRKNNFAAIILLSYCLAALALPFAAKAVTQVDINSSAGSSGSANSYSFVYKFNVPIGSKTWCSITSESNNCLGEYIKAWYGFAIGISGIFATIMIMYGGFKYLASRGDKAQATKGKDYIIGATTGLALVFLSYTIVSLVNPSLTIIRMPALPSFTDTSGINITDQANASESDGTTAPAMNAGNVKTSTDYSKLTGNEAFVAKATAAVNKLKEAGKLPAGFQITSGYRAGSAGQHGAGNAFDCTWSGITQDSAQSFVDSLTAVDPSLSTIIETNGEYGSTWTSTGMGVHVDGRAGTIHLP